MTGSYIRAHFLFQFHHQLVYSLAIWIMIRQECLRTTGKRGIRTRRLNGRPLFWRYITIPLTDTFTDDGHEGYVKPEAFYLDSRYLTVLTEPYEFVITEAERMQTNAFSEESALSFAKTNFRNGKVVKRLVTLSFFEPPANWNPYTEHTLFPVTRGVKLN